MKYFTLVFLILSAVCNSKNGSYPPEVYNRWVHSYEEEENSEHKLFRPADFKEFPPSRFRRIIEIKEDHKASWLHLSPVDAHQMKEGTWSYDLKENTVTIRDEQENIALKFEVIELKEDLLKINYLENE